jgi:UDP:flavonoid glycosyltransferase YjiC (YdhE family)
VRLVLAHDSYRTAARRLQAEIAAQGDPLEAVAAVVEAEARPRPAALDGTSESVPAAS